MPDQTFPGPIGEERNIREAVCIHSNKIYDSCKDKDCLEDLRVYLTTSSQEVVDRALSVKAKSAELVYSVIDVEPVSFNHGCYTVDVHFYYQLVMDAFVGSPRPVEITGVSVFDKRIVLFGGESGSKTFSSRPLGNYGVTPLPTAFMEAVDPIVLGTKMLDVCDARPVDCATLDLPDVVKQGLGDALATDCDGRRLYVSLGQFSIIRLERDTQLLIPAYDYCLPEKECNGGDTPVPEDPCELFRQVSFPVDEFFPVDGSCQSSRTGFGCDQSY
ncbi:MAG: hypothetical protein R3Y07_03280 [Eubacteriales bacterium]